MISSNRRRMSATSSRSFGFQVCFVSPEGPRILRTPNRHPLLGCVTSLILPPTTIPDMARFLTEEWTREAVQALNAFDAVREAVAGVDFTIQQVITGAPSGETKYW